MSITIAQMNKVLKPYGITGGHFNNSGMVEFTANDSAETPASIPLKSLWHMDSDDVLELVNPTPTRIKLTPGWGKAWGGQTV